MNGVALAKVTSARELCTSGKLGLLCDDRGVKNTWLAKAVSAECGLEVTPSLASQWRRGIKTPEDARAVALLHVAEALAEGALH